MTRLRAALSQIRQLRHHPQRKVRFVWWTVTLGLLALGFSQEIPRALLFTLLILINTTLSMAAMFWGVTRFRALWLAWISSARWAFWIAVFTTLATISIVGNLVTETTGITFPANLMLLTAVSVFLPLFFLLSFAISCFGASLGAWAARREEQAEVRRRAARRSIAAIWLAILLGTGTAWLLWERAPQNLTASVIVSLPLFTLGCQTLLRRVEGIREPFYFVSLLGERLVRKRVDREGRVRTRDLRGGVLGLLAAMLALGALRVGLFGGLQASVLAQLMQLSNASALWTSRASAMPGKPGRGPIRVSGGGAPESPFRKKIVLLQMDTAVKRAALTTRSEVAVQADMVRKLTAYGAKCMVLPVPATLTEWDYFDAAASRDALPFTEADTRRSLRDQEALWKALSASQNVVVAAPAALPAGDAPEETTFAAWQARLAKEKSRLGAVNLTAFGVPQLPSLQLDSKAEYAPLPVVIAAKYLGSSPDIRAVPGSPNFVEAAGMKIPLIAPNRMVIFFNNAEAGHDFARITYSDVLRGEALYAGTPTATESQEPRHRWLPPDQYFRDKIVFLDTLVSRRQETPVGAMTRNEALAYATEMFLTKNFLTRARGLWVAGLTLLLGVLLGNACAGKTPIQAVWRILMTLFGVGVISGWFMSQNIWFDPVAPALGAVGAFLMVTQLSFGLERQERARNRGLLQRLVAPEFVEELLEDPEGKLGLHGKRQTVCILFADVRGFTPFAEQNTPETVVEVINAYLTPMTQALLDYGGILDKYTGDGLMAIFRITSTPQENVKKAVQAALDMQAAAAKVSQRLLSEGRMPLPVGIGVHYGEAVVGLVGNPPHQVNYTALGHTVVVSQRLQSLAAGGEIIISEAVYAAVEGAFQVEASAPVTVKGLSAPVRPYRVAALSVLSAPKLPPLPAPSSISAGIEGRVGE